MTPSKLKLARESLLNLQRQHAALVRSAEATLRAIEMAAGILGDMGDVRVRQIMWVVAENYAVTPELLVAPTRGSPNACEARQVAMFLCRELLKLSTPVLGLEFRRDHGSVLWAEKRVAELVTVEKAFAERLAGLRAACAATVVRRAAA